MLSIAEIRDSDYYLRESSETYKAAAAYGLVDYLAEHNPNPHQAQGDDHQPVAPGGSEPKGRWLRIDIEGKITLPDDVLGDGQEVAPEEFVALMKGMHPVTGEALTQQHEKKSIERAHRAGTDLTFSAPKDVSLIAAFETDERKAEIHQSILRASARAMHMLAEQEAMAARHAGQRNGKSVMVRDKAPGMLASQWIHSTSRAWDPQLHVHVVLANVGYRGNGTGALDPSGMYRWKMAAGAVFRAELAQEMTRMGYRLEYDETGMWTVAGVDEKTRKAFSKRANEIEDLANEVDADGLNATSRGKLRVKIALNSRKSKSERPAPEELEQIWDEELNELGLTRQELVQQVREQGQKQAVEEEAKGPDLVAAVHKRVFERRTVAQRQDFMEAAALVARGQGTREITELARQAMASRDLVKLQRPKMSKAERELALEKRGEIPRLPEEAWTTRSIMRMELDCLVHTVGRSEEEARLTAEKAEAVIAQKNTELRKINPAARLRDDQVRSIQHAIAGKGGVYIMPGPPGAGKSTALRCVSQAYERAGYEVIGTAPSWQATKVLSKEIERRDNAMAVQGMAKRLASGELKLTDRHLIIIDEGGMVSQSDWLTISKAAEAARAKVIVSGDDRQLRSVEPGAPFASALRWSESEGLTTVTRQRQAEHVSAVMGMWSRSQERRLLGLQQWQKLGVVKFAETPQDAAANLISEWKKQRQERPEASWLVIASNNADVASLNRRLRAELIAMGRIGQSGTKVSATWRAPGGKGETQEMELAAGEKLIMQASVKKAGLLNGDRLTILAVHGQGDEAVLRVKHGETGAEMNLRWGDLGQGKRPPAITYDYASTVYSSQGMTVDDVLVYQGSAMGRELQMVALSRHRDNLSVHCVDKRLWDRAWIEAEAEAAEKNIPLRRPEQRDIERLWREEAEARYGLEVLDFFRPEEVQRRIRAARMKAVVKTLPAPAKPAGMPKIEVMTKGIQAKPAAEARSALGALFDELERARPAVASRPPGTSALAALADELAREAGVKTPIQRGLEALRKIKPPAVQARQPEAADENVWMLQKAVSAPLPKTIRGRASDELAKLAAKLEEIAAEPEREQNVRSIFRKAAPELGRMSEAIRWGLRLKTNKAADNAQAERITEAAQNMLAALEDGASDGSLLQRLRTLEAHSTQHYGQAAQAKMNGVARLIAEKNRHGAKIPMPKYSPELPVERGGPRL